MLRGPSRPPFPALTPVLISILLLLALLCGRPALAANGLLPDAEPGLLLAAPTNIATDLVLETAAVWVPTADFGAGGGGVGTTSLSVSADYSIFHLSYELTRFDWESEAEVARSFGMSRGVAPWTTLHDVTVQARILNNVFGDGRWRYWVNGEVNGSFEETFPGAVGAGIDGGVVYDVWKGWMVGLTGRTLAVSALSRDLFGEFEVGLALAVSPKSLREALVALGVVEEDADANRFGLNVGLTRSHKTYRLAEDSLVYSDGYMSMVKAKAGIYLDWRAADDLTVSVGPEYHYARKYELYNAAGVYKSSHRLDDSLGGYLRFSWRF